jgi:SAM-dependent methyltransferase
MPAFTEPALSAFYGTADRLTARTSALHAAKTVGEDATETIMSLAMRHARNGITVCEIGCGRGTTAVALATRLAPMVLIALDQSAALLGVTRSRFAAAGCAAATVRADFHRLPLRDASTHLIIAAFCLYHSRHPQTVLAEVRRCLVPGGAAVLATKSADSYRQIDALIADSGLDPAAAGRPSPWATFHSGNAAALTDSVLPVHEVVHQRHEFLFSDLDQLAAYAITSPTYRLPEALTADPGRFAAELRRRVADQPVTATSTITYLTAIRP